MAKPSDVDRTLRQIARLLGSSQLSRDLGNSARDIIFKRTKTGGGVSSDTSSNPQPTRLKVLSPSTIAQRQRRGVTGSNATARFSNATDSGQMLDSIQVIAKPGEFELIIPNTDRRRRGNEKRVPTNAEVADHYSADRPFFALTFDEQNILRREVTDRMRKIIRRLT